MSSMTQTTDWVMAFIPLCHVMVFLLLLDLPVSSKRNLWALCLGRHLPGKWLCAATQINWHTQGGREQGVWGEIPALM